MPNPARFRICLLAAAALGGCTPGAADLRGAGPASTARRAAPTTEVLPATESWSAELDVADARLGRCVASAGDVNGDGYDDVLAGAVYYSDGEMREGGAFLYLGSASGPATTAAWTAEADQAGAMFGGSLASAGDVNGDGYADVIVGAFGYAATAPYEGRAWVYLGSPEGLETSAAWTADGGQERATFGRSVASAGDVNGDGYDDVIIGAPAYDNPEVGEGRAFVYLGSAVGLDTAPAWTAESNQASSDFGWSVASAGDVDGDGYDDVLVGAPEYDHPEIREGAAFLYLGSATGLATSASWTDESNSFAGELGLAVAGAGDVDADGYDDVIIGAPYVDGTDGGAGQARLFRGTSAGLERTAAWTTEGSEHNAFHGFSVASAGDVDGDGYADVVVGARNTAPGGTVALYRGSAGGLLTDPTWTVDSDQEGAAFGASVASAGDVDADGYADLVVGAYDYSNGEVGEGRVTVYTGGDLDGDGWTAAEDCDDTDPSNHPGGIEVCDAADNDCDGIADNGAVDADRWHPDADGDGYGAGTSLSSCEAPIGYAANGLDCDDTAATVHPGADEHCNGLDDDCDGTIDDAAVDPSVWYPDTDGDGYGIASDERSACDAPAGYVADATDCADTEATVHPGAEERCDGVDTNCDGTPDDGAVDAPGWYADHDADGHGFGAPTAACDTPAGFVASADDCDDTTALASPEAAEVCDGLDNDCDLLVDEADAVDGSAWYRDLDGDTFGDPAVGTSACTAPDGFVADATDCIDTAEVIHPGSAETCNGLDDDCDGAVDEGATGPGGWYTDADGDGFGDRVVVSWSCEAPDGTVANALDCDDTSGVVNPAAPEVAYDGIDQDCDGGDRVDVDADGFDAVFVGGDDCDDGDETIHPGASERANGADDDCNGSLDDTTSWGDDDGDGVTEVAGDCDDTTATIGPGAEETPNGNDDDCDGAIDEGTTNADDDGDGYSEADGDCVDGDVAIHPGGVELEDGIDNDCDGVVDDGSLDDDDDGFGDDVDCAPTDATIHPGAAETADGEDNDCDGTVDEGTSVADDDGDGASEADGDCDDADASVGPGAPELANGWDDNCDGTVDEGTERYDDDGDGLSELAGDCDDADPAVRPGVPEVPDNGIDDNCDGDLAERGVDADGDGYTVADGDCDDLDGWAHPGLTELCDGRDNNCDGNADDGGVCGGATKDSGVPEAAGCASVGYGKQGLAGLLALVTLRRRAGGGRPTRPTARCPGQPR